MTAYNSISSSTSSTTPPILPFSSSSAVPTSPTSASNQVAKIGPSTFQASSSVISSSSSLEIRQIVPLQQTLSLTQSLEKGLEEIEALLLMSGRKVKKTEIRDNVRAKVSPIYGTFDSILIDKNSLHFRAYLLLRKLFVDNPNLWGEEDHRILELIKFPFDKSLIEAIDGAYDHSETCREFINSISKIENLGEDVKWELISQFITLKQISSAELFLTSGLCISEDEWKQLSKTIRYLDFRDLFYNGLNNSLVRRILSPGSGCIPNLRYLRLAGDGIKKVLMIENLRWLEVEDSGDLSQVPDYSHLLGLVIRKCHKLKEIPPLSQCRYARISDCWQLEKVLGFQKCEYLWLTDCPRGPLLPPALPRIIYFDYAGSLLLRLPQIPHSARVRDDERSPFYFMDVHVEELETKSDEYLLGLEENLSRNYPFPNIYYFQKGKEIQNIDGGNIRRHFITQMMTQLFRQQHGTSNPKAWQLVKDKLEQEGNIHI